MTRKNITSLAIVVVIGIVIQAGFIALDCKSTPAETAVKFARAYYRLSPAMAELMCATSSAACGNCALAGESAGCANADCGMKTAICPKAESASEPEKCTKAASAHGAADCPKVEDCPKAVDCPKSAECPKAADCPKAAECPKAVAGCDTANCPQTPCCKKPARRVDTAVEDYLYDARLDAAERGFGENFAKYTLDHIETRTEYIDENNALVHLTARSRLRINPVYAYVARLFRIGDTYEVDESIQVKLVDGRWQVCESSLLPL